MSVGATLCRVVCGGGCCACLCAHDGEITHAKFPRNEKELSKMGAAYMTKVLTDNGTLKGGVTVTAIKTIDMNDKGLLGELIAVELTFSGATDAPKKLVAKFRPPDLDTRITCSLFELHRTEMDFYRHVAPTMKLRIPKLVFGDIHRPSDTSIMMIEHIDADFRRIQDETPVELTTKIVMELANLQSLFWGGAYANANVDFVPSLDGGANLMIPSVTKKNYGKFFNGVVAAEANKASDEMKAFLDELYKDVPMQQAIMRHSANVDGWRSIYHGDPRVDNFFFNEKSTGAEIGLLDWQLTGKGFCGIDMSWFFTTTVDADAEGSDKLVDLYYKELSENRKKADGQGLPSVAEFKEELALCHTYSFMKVIIGAGGLDKNDANTVEVMSILCRRGLKAMAAHGTIEAFAKFKSGELLSQKRKGKGGGGGGKTQSNPASGGTASPSGGTPVESKN